jgi:hypothetical protein
MIVTTKPRLHYQLAALLVILSILACNLPISWTDSLAPGGTWYVDKTGNDSNDCLSATSACLTITAAVSKVLTGGVIQIGAGTFEEISSTDPDNALYYTGLYINNKLLTLRGTVTGGAPETIISGADTRTAVLVRGSAIVIVQDLIIQGGGSTGNGLNIDGGSAGTTAGVELRNVIIRNNDSTGLFITGRAPVTLDNVQVLANRFGLVATGPAAITIRNNSTFSGNTDGAIQSSVDGRMVITDTTITDNGSANNQGAVENKGEMRIERTTISGTTRSGDLGGTGVIHRGILLTMIDSIVTLNSGMGIGSYGELDLNGVEVSHNNEGGVKIFAPINATLHDIAVIENRGFGIHSQQGHVTIYNSHIAGNQTGFFNAEWATIISTEIAGNYGSGVVNSVDGTMIIDSSTISGTLPDGTSGNTLGLYNMGTSMTVTNSTISGNTQQGILTGESMSLIFSTVAENGTVGIYASSGSVVNLENSIIENNVGGNCGISYAPPTARLEKTGVILSDASCVTSLGEGTAIVMDSDAFLDGLADNGGSGQTNALLPGSLAIDAATGSCPATDQRGIARPQGTGCDIGAYEYEGGSAIAPLEFVTPIYTDTPASKIPIILTFTKNAYCRKGPGVLYRDISGFKQGDTAQADGRNDADPRWWWVRMPNSTEHCWVSYTTVATNDLAEGLPIQPMTSLELPQPPGEFVISKRVCTAKSYALRFAWTKSSDADGYILYRDGQEIATFKATQTTFDDIPSMNQYHLYELVSFNADGYSERLGVEDNCP